MDQKFINALQLNDLPELKRFATIMAVGINIDKYESLLSDKEVMAITTSIYTCLVGLVNYKVDGPFKAFIDKRVSKIPKSLDIATLPENFIAALMNLIASPKISFESEFLNKQFDLGNIKFEPLTKSIILQYTSDFKSIDTDPKKHKAKILTHLKKEGYKYDYGINGYIKS